MKLLVLSDTQIGAGTALAHDRLADQEAMLAQIADLADEHAVAVVLHLGDVFERRHPSEEERLVFKRWAYRISAGRRLIAIQGNHDSVHVEAAAALQLYDDCEFIRRPTVLDLGGCSLACLPWAPTSGLVARLGGRDGDVNAMAADCLVGIAKGLYEECVYDGNIPEQPFILATHFWIEGATSATGAGESVIYEPVLPIGELEAIGFDAIVSGHVHRSAMLGERTLMAGTPWVNNFGEADLPHGVWIVDTGALVASGETSSPLQGDRVAPVTPPDAPSALDFVPVADRRFVSVDVYLPQDSPGGRADSRSELRESDGGSGDQAPGMGARTPEPHLLDETDLIAAAVIADGGGELDGAVMRITYRATEDQHRRVDHAAIRRLCDDAGVHKLAQLRWEPVRTTRARAEGADESLDPLAALDLWIAANDVGEVQAGRLRALASEWVTA